MRLSLELKPANNSFIKILQAFNNGTPLTSDQINFLRHYHTKLSNTKLDLVCKYYGILKNPELKIPQKSKGLVLISPPALKDEVTTALKNAESYELNLNFRQLYQFKIMLMHELIFLHDTHTLTGAPFLARGVPHVEFFQWGKLFGVVEYEKILGETSLDPHILMYFEKKRDQTLAEFAKQYRKHEPSRILQPRMLPISSSYDVDEKTLSQQFLGTSRK